MIIAHNLGAMNAQRQYNIVNNRKAKTSEKLSSGYKINRAADDAAGLSISEKMRRQIRGLTQGVENTQEGVSLCQVADGALAEVNEMLHRITELSVKSANGTNSEQDRQYIQEEINQILQDIDRISDTTTFNEQNIFGGKNAVALGGSESSSGTTAGTTGGTNSNQMATWNGTTIVSGGIVDLSNMPQLGSDRVYSINTTEPIIIKGNGASRLSGFKALVEGVDITIDNVTLANEGQLDFMGKDNKLTLVGTNRLSADYTSVIHVGAGTELSIDGSGSLILSSLYKNGALIGGNSYEDGGKIIINGGNFTFDANDPNNSSSGAAIGGGQGANGGEIIINGGNIDIDIWGGGAAVGGGASGDGGKITMNGGTLTVDNEGHGACIGGGINNDGGTFTYNGGSLNLYNLTMWGETIGHGREGSDSGTIVNNTGQSLTEVSHVRGVAIQTVAPNHVPSGGNGGNTNTNPSGTVVGDGHWWIQSGCEAGDGMWLEIDRMNTSILGIRGVDVSTVDGANHAIDAVKGALQRITANRSKIGAQQNRLEHTIANEENIVENTIAAESRIRDTDMAKTMVEYSNTNILLQAGQAMMAQANQSNQGVLSLLQ